MTTTIELPTDGLPAVSAALAVIAHPDDESFGMGAVLSALVDAGCQLAAVCFTHGEASTLGAADGHLHGASQSGSECAHQPGSQRYL